MSARSARLLRRQVTRILEQCKVKGPAVPVAKIARQLGAEIRFVPYEGELAGMFARYSDGKAVIGINSKLPKSRQRYTIAHELGHFVLHDLDMHIDRDFRTPGKDKDVDKINEELETEANRFAAELLMPYDMLMPELEQHGIDMEHLDEVGTLAKRYDVSTQAMMRRIASLIPF